ncbi:MAG: 50S ribosomal protein L32 [Chloroflexi bacterium]|nr:50S ribosomal protein L32 [Chloroflexota bacterium]
MGALPKRKLTASRRGNRRSHQSAVTATLVRCGRCRSMRQAHHACPVCGFYNGRTAIEIPLSTQPES